MHLGMIGFGNIGQALLAQVPQTPVTDVTVLVRGSSNVAPVRPAGIKITFVTALDALREAAPDLVVECAGHAAVASCAPAILLGGTDLVIASLGALADADLHDRLMTASARPGAGRMIFPIGAVGGLDMLRTLAPVGGLEVRYEGRKPPAAWKGSPADALIDLDSLTDATRFFTGTAREAARAFPKNANVVAALALAGAGFDATQVALIADPGASGNTHSYSVVSPICRYRMEIAAIASPDNPRTSATTAWSILAEIRSFAALRPAA